MPSTRLWVLQVFVSSMVSILVVLAIGLACLLTAAAQIYYREVKLATPICLLLGVFAVYEPSAALFRVL